MSTVYVGVGEYAVVQSPTQYIKTLALGSCVAVVIMSPSRKAVGLLHVALPESAINQNRAVERPGMFADTGIPKVLEEMQQCGYADDDLLVIKLAGGAGIMDPDNTLNIGKKNVLAVKKCLWRYKLGVIAEDVCGNISRSLSVDLSAGKVVVSSPGRGEWEI